MSDLAFEVIGARPLPAAAAPTLAFPMSITTEPGRAVQSIQLRCQIRIEPALRPYDAREKELLLEVFGEPERWGSTLKSFLLTHVGLPVPAFDTTTQVELAVPLSYDLEVTAGKYLHALRGGEVALLFLFSGTVFERTEQGMQIQQIPWDCEARFALPVQTWAKVMDAHFPGSGWLRLQRDTTDALTRFKATRAIPTWDEAVAELLAQAEVPS
jgi:hypothetical protein